MIERLCKTLHDTVTRNHRHHSMKALMGAGDRAVRTGTRWQLGPDAVLGIEGSRQASEAGEADNRQMLKAALRF